MGKGIKNRSCFIQNSKAHIREFPSPSWSWLWQGEDAAAAKPLRAGAAAAGAEQRRGDEPRAAAAPPRETPAGQQQGGPALTISSDSLVRLTLSMKFKIVDFVRRLYGFPCSLFSCFENVLSDDVLIRKVLQKQLIKVKEVEKVDQTKENNNNGNNVHFATYEDLKNLIEKQNEQINKQSEEIKGLKKKIDENEKFALDFRSELSEVRKKWQSMGDIRQDKGTVNHRSWIWYWLYSLQMKDNATL